MHAVKTVEDRCTVDLDFNRVVSTLESQVQVGTA
jgi:hypothetical protein